MVTEDGVVKILDFGLAKLTEPSNLSEAPTRDVEMAYTKEGHVVGTVPYMSPEQVQGRKVDERSDIFSFGCVLYEMVTGSRPFKSDSAAGVLAAIIRDEPKRVKEIVPASPAALETTIQRALKKDPEDRHPSMAELHRELCEIQSNFSTKRSISSAVLADFPEKLVEAPLIRIAALCLVLLGMAYLVNDIMKPPPPPVEVLPLTTMEGVEMTPALSSDGKQVAYIWNGSEDGFYHIYVQLVSGGRPLQLTDASTNDCCPAWSPDGSEIVFQRSGAKGAEIYSISSLGGSETRLAITPGFGFTAMRLDWSPDGSTIAMTDVDESDTPPGIFLLSTETGEKKRVTAPPAGDQILDIDPEISPDGRTLAFIRSKHGPTGVADIYVQPIEGGDAIRVTTSELPLYDMDWTADGKALVYASIGRPTSDSWLWKVPAGGGEPSRLPFGEGAQNVSIARNGNHLVFSQKIEEVNIWRLNGPESSAPGPPTKLISSTRRDYQPQYSPDGSKIAFFSDRTGRGSIWICASDGSNPIELTQEEQAIWPSWSPSGRMIAFNAWDIERGSADVYVIDAAGGFPRNLTNNEFDDGGPGWSSDEEWIYFVSDRTGDRQIWKLSIEGGPPQQVTTNGGRRPVEAGNGEVFFHREDRIWRMPSDRGDAGLVIDKWVGQSYCLWRNHVVYYARSREEGLVIEMLDLTSDETKRIAALGRMGLRWGLTVSPDGRWILLSKVDRSGSDLVLVEHFR